MTMHSTWNGPTADDFAAIEKLRTRHSALMKRATRQSDADAAQDVAKPEKSRQAALAGSGRVTFFAVGAGLAAAIALGTAGFWSVEVVRPRMPGQSVTAGPDAAAKKKLAEAMRAAPQASEGAWVIPVSEPILQPRPTPRLSEADLVDLREKSAGLIAEGQIAAARAFLERAARANDAAALFALAQTYDPQALQDWKTVGIAGDEIHAREIYRKAAAAGSEEARRRLTEMRD